MSINVKNLDTFAWIGSAAHAGGQPTGTILTCLWPILVLIIDFDRPWRLGR